MSLLAAELSSLDIDICFVTETWFTSEITDCFSCIPGFDCYRSDRTALNSQKSSAGGVCIYTHKYVRCIQKYPEQSEVFEILWLQVYAKRPLLLCCVYVPPDMSTTKQADLLEHITSTCDTFLDNTDHGIVVVAGGFNTFRVSKLHGSTSLCSLNTRNTRDRSVLDYVFTSHPCYYEDILLTKMIFRTDHFGIVCSPRERLPSTRQVKLLPDCRARNMQLLHSMLCTTDFQSVAQLANSDIKAATEQLTEILQSALNTACPKKQVTIKSRDPPYMTPLIKTLLKRKQRLVRHQRWHEVELLSKRIGNLIMDNTKHNEQKIGTKLWWNKTKNYIGKKRPTTFPPEFDVNSKNQMFADICTTSNYKLPETPALKLKDTPSLSLHQVYYGLSSVSRTACGSDNILWYVFREFAHILTPVVHVIFTESLRQGIFPAIWKRAIVTPLPKTTPPRIDSLRPVSITPVVARIFERLVDRFFISELYHRKLDSSQFGFRQHGSTSTMVVKMQNIIQCYKENNYDYVRIISLDLSKAFDRVSHQLIVSSLNNIGADPNIVCWIASFLRDRQQKVVSNGRPSQWLSINQGVPQGTVGGPKYFNISTLSFTLPSELTLRNSLVKFADESYPCCAGKNGDDDAEKVLDFVKNWCYNNEFVLNCSKSKKLVIKLSRNTILPSAFPDVTRVTEMNIVGIMVSNTMSLSNHINYLISKARRNVYLLLKLKRTGYNKLELSRLYNAFILSTLTYGIEAYASVSNTDLNRIDSLQRRCVHLGIIDEFKDIHSVSIDRDQRLLNKCLKYPQHPLHSLIPSRTDYASTHLRDRHPPSIASRTHSIFPNRCLGVYFL